MTPNSASEVNSRVRELVEQHDKIGVQFSAYLKKVHERLAKLKKALGDKPITSGEIAKLVADLKAVGHEPDRLSIAVLVDELQRVHADLRRSLESHFGDHLRKACQDVQLSFRPIGDGFAVGPFLLEMNLAKEQAALSYAKLPVDKDLALDVASIVTKAQNLKSILVDPPVDLKKLSGELEEAMAVALVRRNKTLKDQGRVELPLIYREMLFIRQVTGANDGYSTARFVVELKTLVQSEQNLEARRQFVLETAVLENTKDSRKSIFIPRDIQAGYGEGTYFQALLIKTS